MTPCGKCFHFSSGEGRIKGKEDFCCISLTVNSLKRDYPGIFKSAVQFPPSQGEFEHWSGKDTGCDFFKARMNPAEMLNA